MKFVLATVYICLSGGNVCESHQIRIENCKSERHNAQIFSQTDREWKSGYVGITCSGKK